LLNEAVMAAVVDLAVVVADLEVEAAASTPAVAVGIVADRQATADTVAGMVTVADMVTAAATGTDTEVATDTGDMGTVLD
jgi:hypothetical protein